MRETSSGAAPLGVTGVLSAWLAETALDQIPVRVQERVKHLLLDGIGCAMVGAQLDWSRIGVEAITGLEAGTSPLIGWGGRATSAAAAAMLNSSFIQGFELDDYHPLAPLHSASIVLPAILAAADGMDAPVPGSMVLLAAIRGFEIGPRVGLGLHGGEMLTRGWHSGPVFGTFTAAAAAGTVYGLDAAGFEDALGIAATQSGGLMAAQFESMVKRMQHGFAARNGLYAAKLAAGGYVGIKRVLERPYGGFLSTFGEGHSPDPSAVVAALGERWETEKIAVKPYAAMGGLHAAIDAALELRAAAGFDPAALERISIAMSKPAFEHGGWVATRPLEPIGAQMNAAYATAVALLDGAALVDQFSSARINADDVWQLIERTDVHHDPDLDLLPADEQLTTTVEITYRTGQSARVTVSHPRGTGKNLLSNQDVVEKYRSLTQHLISPERQRDIERTVLGIEELDDVSDLAGLLTPAVTSALG